jgi:hypothetical protein
MEKPCSHIGEWGFLINGYRISNLDISNIHQKKTPWWGVF